MNNKQTAENRSNTVNNNTMAIINKCNCPSCRAMNSNN